MCVSTSMYICALCVFRCLWRPEEGIRSSGTGVPLVVSYHMGAETQTRVLYKSNKCISHWAISPAWAFCFLSYFVHSCCVSFLKYGPYLYLPDIYVLSVWLWNSSPQGEAYVCPWSPDLPPLIKEFVLVPSGAPRASHLFSFSWILPHRHENCLSELCHMVPQYLYLLSPQQALSMSDFSCT